MLLVLWERLLVQAKARLMWLARDLSGFERRLRVFMLALILCIRYTPLRRKLGLGRTMYHISSCLNATARECSTVCEPSCVKMMVSSQRSDCRNMQGLTVSLGFDKYDVVTEENNHLSTFPPTC
jgi:hypothetical protein